MTRETVKPELLASMRTPRRRSCLIDAVYVAQLDAGSPSCRRPREAATFPLVGARPQVEASSSAISRSTRARRMRVAARTGNGSDRLDTGQLAEAVEQAQRVDPSPRLA